ncbi:type II toxin-antitoxin system VapC family toxin [Tessaracoccus caeni]|uniref:type II toxin-antitoxin system VapC family toxin n=1 Tax=Tessaracoccus caeni TaxID=3031239 RepID=UPI0023DA8F45|nr:type II toxin-antitoxin system VapC family toxin [Tessaracoccus caeni]MDF1487224.1 type II toxin-antitoxin system VapC family toxin [Tessaracoccus caeni]
MIVLDTNVISEALKGPQADPNVIAWLSSLSAAPVTTIVNRAELLAGVALLPDGRRKEVLHATITAQLARMGTCLPLTEEAADCYAEIQARRQEVGRPISGFDGLIAAICLASSSTLATRNTKDFEGLGLDLINPWLLPH